MMKTLTSPMRRLRSMIADSTAGLISPTDLLNELSNLEARLGLPLTDSEVP